MGMHFGEDPFIRGAFCHETYPSKLVPNHTSGHRKSKYLRHPGVYIACIIQKKSQILSVKHQFFQYCRL